jgi:tRNA wybutosine-synthesizing protein 4
VDVDYRELMITKAGIVRETDVLDDLVRPKDGSNVDFVIEGERYYGIGCDLRDIRRLDAAIKSLADLENTLVLCIAEVSITYMDPDAADALISWAGKLSAGKMVLTMQWKTC